MHRKTRLRRKATPQTHRAPVTLESLQKRINTTQAKSGRQLRISRIGRARAELGEFYVTDGSRVVQSHVDIEALGREVGAMRDWESLVA